MKKIEALEHERILLSAGIPPDLKTLPRVAQVTCREYLVMTSDIASRMLRKGSCPLQLQDPIRPEREVKT